MKNEMKFYRCNSCGNIVALVKNGGGPLDCCGKPMELLAANTVEASAEKHIPAITRDEKKIYVNVGSIDHPMAPEHFIEWVYFQSEGKGQIIYLEPGDKPNVHFGIGHRKPIAVYAYCNLHGLWKADLSE